MNGTYYNAWHSNAWNLGVPRVLLVGDMRVHRLRPFLQAWVSVPVDSFASNCSGDVEDYCTFLKKWITQYTYSIVFLDSSFKTVFTDCETLLREAIREIGKPQVMSITLGDYLLEEKYAEGIKQHFSLRDFLNLIKMQFGYLSSLYKTRRVNKDSVFYLRQLYIFSTLIRNDKANRKSYVYNLYAAALSTKVYDSKEKHKVLLREAREDKEWCCLSVLEKSDVLLVGDCHMRAIYACMLSDRRADLFSSSLCIVDDMWEMLFSQFFKNKYKFVVFSVGSHIKKVDIDLIEKSLNSVIQRIKSTSTIILCTVPNVIPVGISKAVADDWNEKN